MVKNKVFSGFARLPVELVNVIFTLAAESSRHTCLDLCLVASWARQIALPHLFRTLVATDHGVKFDKYLACPPYVPFNTKINAASLVENVWIPLEDDGATDSVLDVFENCHNIMHLALTTHCFYKLISSTTSKLVTQTGKRKAPDPTLDDHRDLHLTMLGASSFVWTFQQMWSPIVRSPLYDRITHIRVETVNSYKIPQRYRLYHFSRLSHLSVPYYNSMQHIAKHLNVFLKLRSLEMFVVAGVRKPLQQAHWKRLEEWVQATRKRDKRVFFVEVPAMDIQAEWEWEMRGGESIWDRAFRYTTQWEGRKRELVEMVRMLVCSRVIVNLFTISQERQRAKKGGVAPRRSSRRSS